MVNNKIVRARAVKEYSSSYLLQSTISLGEQNCPAFKTRAQNILINHLLIETVQYNKHINILVISIKEKLFYNKNYFLSSKGFAVSTG